MAPTACSEICAGNGYSGGFIRWNSNFSLSANSSILQTPLHHHAILNKAIVSFIKTVLCNNVPGNDGDNVAVHLGHLFF